MKTSYKVLDHGVVSLVDSMPAHDPADWPCCEECPNTLGAGDQRVVQAARVSFAHIPDDMRKELGLELPPTENHRTVKDDIKLIHYLLKNRHTSPFEKVRFEIYKKLPIFVARQFIRHRMGSFNEQSARYSKLDCEFYVPELSRMQAQSTSNKQASGEQLKDEVSRFSQDAIRVASVSAYSTYEALLERGLARELARMVLPTNFYTSWYWTVDLHNLMGFLSQRLHSHAQWEARQYAKAIYKLALPVAPVTLNWFAENTPGLDLG